MEDQDKYFYESQLNFFGQDSPHYPIKVPSSQSFALFHKSSSEKSPDAIMEEKPNLFRAYNPMDQLKNIPEGRQHEFMFFLHNNKTFNGIQHFFSSSDDQHKNGFLENIELDAYGKDNDFQLDKLFHGEIKDIGQRQLIQNTLLSLQTKLDLSTQKTLSSVNFNRSISSGFYEHFENFSLVVNSSNFLSEFEHNFKNMVQQAKKFKGPGIDLTVFIYDFWLRSFKDFMSEIWKYSSKFTLNFFKKNEPQDVESSSQNAQNSSEIRSESSNTMGSKDKRKGWTKEQTDYLMKCIQSNIIFTQSVLKTLSSHFNRSASSISSKIQKLIKSRKGQQIQEDSLLTRTIEILKMEEQGLTRDTIIEKINQNYEMGYGGQWEKSVGQLLSSKKEFIKIRGKHSLLNPENLMSVYNNVQDKSKLTFKDKVVQIFLTMPDYKADLKTLVEKYVKMYGQGEFDGDPNDPLIEQKKKTIQGNISKTLSRYDIFDSSNAKTKYLLNPLIYKASDKKDMDVENFLSL